MADGLNPALPAELTALGLDTDDFRLFGLPAQMALDPAVLDAAWKRLQSVAHPDRFASADAATQRLAMQWAVRINEAFRRLKSPLARASYLCERHGTDLQAENNTAMPAAFLMQQMAWREALDEARTLDEAEALADEVAAHRRQALSEITQAIDGAPQVDWPAVAAQVRGLMFVERFAADIARRIDALSD